jgi:hypothetical protein
MAKKDYTITKKSMISGKENTFTIRMDPQDYNDWLNKRKLIQDALPYVSAEDREFLMTGVTPEEWKQLFADGDEADDSMIDEDLTDIADGTKGEETPRE